MNEKIPLLILAQADDPFRLRLEQWVEEHAPFVLPLSISGAEHAEIVVLSPNLREAPELAFPQKPYLIFRSDSVPAAEFAALGRFHLLDYGFSLRDSLTFSSVSEKQAVIALQRPLTLPGGELTEPMEYPLTLTRKPDSDVLLAAAGICLLGKKMESLASFP